MTERVVSVRLQARVEGFTAGMQKAKASVDDLTKAAAPSKADAFGKMADKAALAGAGVAVAVGVAVKRFADFDQAMSAVKANSGATGASLEALRQAAVTMGADSQFSATEAAQGINAMAKAGVEAKDILGGGLKGALDLAAAGQISVADAAETAATAMTVFKLNGSQIPHVADLLANASNKAQGGVGDMAAALKQAGLVAAGMGLNIEETTAGLTAFASAGLLGSDAGTSFKTMLQRLAAPQGEAKALMEKLNISAYDSQGNFVGLAQVAEQLKTSMQNMTPAQRAAAQSVIFGSDAVRAANVLYEQGADGINKWTKEVSEQGAAAKQAATLTDNLKGDIERLGGALDSVFINTGSGANGSLRGLTQGVTGLVNVVGEVPGPVLLAGGALTAFALVVPKGVLAFRNYQAQLEATGLSLDKISAKAPRAARALDTATKASLALAAIATAGAVAQSFQDQAAGANEATKSLEAYIARGAESKAVTDIMREGFNSLDQQVSILSVEGFGKFGQSLDDAASGFGIFGKSLSETSADFFKEVDTGLAGLVASGRTEQAAEVFEKISVSAKRQGVSLESVKDALPGYEAALSGVQGQTTKTADGQNVMTDATDAVAKSADDAKKAMDNLRDSIEGLGSPFAAQRAAERDFQQSIDDTADRLRKRTELQKELRDAEAQPAKTKDERKSKADEIARLTEELAKYSKGFDVNTEAGRANQEALDNIRTATLRNVDATFESTGSVDKATDAMKRGRDAFIKAAEAAGATKTQAKELADQLGLVPKDVSIIVKQSGAAEANAAIDAAARDRTTTITVRRRIADLKDKQASDAGAVPEWAGATGGAVFGRGTGTSDSIHALLSNGEHVWTAAEVKALGGQGAMYALRAAVRAGNAPRFAAGGAVAASPTLAPSLMVSRGSDGMGRMSVDGRLDLGNGLTGFIRAIANDAMDERARNGNLRRVGG